VRESSDDGWLAMLLLTDPKRRPMDGADEAARGKRREQAEDLEVAGATVPFIVYDDNRWRARRVATVLRPYFGGNGRVKGGELPRQRRDP